MEDELVWLPVKTGNYSTKTGYALCKLNIGEVDLSFDWKKLVWGVKTFPKLKHFLWKIKNKALSVKENLIHRGMEVDGRCKRCGVLETERHLFFQCPFAVQVWQLVPILHNPDPTTISTPASLLIACQRMINLPPTGLYDTALFPWVLWYLWTARNKALFEGVVMTEQEVASQATKEARIWQAAQIEKPISQAAKTLNTVPRPCGSTSSSTQCFVDAAWNATTRRAGFGCIFKEPSTGTIHQASANRCHVGSAFIAEALAVKTALLEAINLGLRTLTIWSDSKSLITTILSCSPTVEAQGVLFDISHLCTLFSSVSFHHVPRLNNTEADALAKLALSNPLNFV